MFRMNVCLIDFNYNRTIFLSVTEGEINDVQRYIFRNFSQTIYININCKVFDFW